MSGRNINIITGTITRSPIIELVRATPHSFFLTDRIPPRMGKIETIIPINEQTEIKFIKSSIVYDGTVF